MAPMQSDSEDSESGSSVSGSETNAPVDQTNGVQLEDGEEEFHTEDSEGSEAETGAQEEAEDESDLDNVHVNNAPVIPLLPEHLLKTQSQPVFPAPALASVPWDQLTSKQKKARRNNSRKMKKRTYDRLREGTRGTGTLKAGKVAQIKRGVELDVPGVGKRVKSGRVEKKRAGEAGDMSGRQKMVEERKRAVRGRVAGSGGGGKAKRKSKR